MASRLPALGLALAFAGGSATATASGWLGASATPVEHRVAIAAGPVWTTVWTSIRFEGAAGPVGVVLSVAPGAVLDLASDAWLESLERATAPRIFPPTGLDPVCPGEQAPAHPFHVAGDTAPMASLAPTETTVLPDAAAVLAWAAAHSMSASAGITASLAEHPGPFLAARFAGSGVAGSTRTLRAAIPGPSPALPLALVQANAAPLRVTLWLLGAGRGSLAGAVPAALDLDALFFRPHDGTSSYFAARAGALGLHGASGALLESASHGALNQDVSLDGGKSSIPSVVRGYLERAADYGEGDAAAGCLATAASSLGSTSPVAASCPRGGLGVVGEGEGCVEAPGAGQTDPETLRCGGMTDDLAVALAGLVPAGAWVTRFSTLVPGNQGGMSFAAGFGPGAAVVPVLEAQGLDLAGCFGGGGGGATGSTSSSASSSSSSSGPSGAGPSAGVGPGVGAGAGGYGGDSAGSELALDLLDPEVGCHCSGDTIGSEIEPEPDPDDLEDPDVESEDGCSGDTEDSADDDGCSGDTEGSADDDGCSGDTEDSSDDGCSGDSTEGDDGCSVLRESRARRRKPPKLSVITLVAVALLAPLRRARRRKRAPSA